MQKNKTKAYLRAPLNLTKNVECISEKKYHQGEVTSLKISLKITNNSSNNKIQLFLLL